MSQLVGQNKSEEPLTRPIPLVLAVQQCKAVDKIVKKAQITFHPPLVRIGLAVAVDPRNGCNPGVANDN
jgi:hypothetical protein